MVVDLDIVRISGQIARNMRVILDYITGHPYRSALMFMMIAAGYFAFSALGVEKLEFVDLSSPSGFRALVLDGKSSRFDPILGSLRKTSNPDIVADTAPDATETCDALLRDEGSPYVGVFDNSLSVVEFFDYKCPYCKTLVDILADIRANVDFRLIYKEWPILGESSQMAARAALAAAKQGKYLAFHTKLMQSGFIPTSGYIEDLSGRLGINHAKLLDDMSSDETSAQLRRNHALASKLGLVGTPVLIVGRTIVEGAITQNQLEQLIAEEMASPQIC